MHSKPRANNGFLGVNKRFRVRHSMMPTPQYHHLKLFHPTRVRPQGGSKLVRNAGQASFRETRDVVGMHTLAGAVAKKRLKSPEVLHAITHILDATFASPCHINQLYFQCV